MYQEGIVRELRCAHEVGRVQLVFVERVVSKHLKYVCQQADVAQELKLHIIIEAITLKIRVHLFGVCVIGLETLHVAELVEERISLR